MAGERQLPGIGLHAYWTPGSNGWNTQHDPDTRKASVLIQLAVEDIVSSLPGSPAQGDIYITTGAGHVNEVAAYDNAAWVYYTPGEGWIAFEKSSGLHYKFDGSNWTPLIPTSELPAYGAGDELKLLRVNVAGDGIEWFTLTSDLPTFVVGDALKLLRINAAGDGVEWFSDTSSFPAIVAGDAGKALVVNATEDGYEWFEIAQELPAFGAPQALMALRVNATGDGLEWVVGGGLPSYGVGDAGKILAVNATEDGLEFVDPVDASGNLNVVSQITSFNLSAFTAHDYVRVTGASPVTATVPASGTLDFPIGTTFTIFQEGAGAVTIEAAVGVTILTPDTLVFRKQGSAATLVKVATDTWTLTGDLVVV